MPRAPKPETPATDRTWNRVDESISTTQQGINYVSLVSRDGLRVRLTVKSDSYEFQSLARAEVWSSTTMTWNEVWTLQYRQNPVATLKVHGTTPASTHMVAFRTVGSTLLNMVEKIVL